MTNNNDNFDCVEKFLIAKIIYKEAFNLDSQLKNIFAAAELEAGEASINIANVDIENLLCGIIDVYKHVAIEKKINIVFSNEILDNEHYFKTDAEKLHLVISNLLSNAIEYSPNGSKLEIKTWLENGFLKVSVKDYGIGIRKTDQKKIFDRFTQLDSGVKKEHKGQGLGLSITKQILDLLEGSISVSSMKNKGSIFTISVPESDIIEDQDLFAPDGNELMFDIVKQF